MPSPTEFKQSLVVVGHGWPELAPALNPVLLVVDRLNGLGIDATGAFLKQEPVFTQPNPGTTVVPFFMSEGFFASKVRALAVGGRCTRAVGASTKMQDVVDDALKGTTGSVIITGHGTAKHSRSRSSVLNHAERLGTCRKVFAAFIDDEPSLGEVVGQLDGDASLLPYFAAPGPHTLVDIPAVVEANRPAKVEVAYLPAIGLSDAMLGVVLDLLAVRVR